MALCRTVRFCSDKLRFINFMQIIMQHSVRARVLKKELKQILVFNNIYVKEILELV